MELLLKGVEETIALAKQIGLKLQPGDVLLLDGDLGAGKTTFTKGIGEALNVKRTINSPTFTIMKVYQGNYTLYHFDLYRLNGEGMDFDLEDYIFGDGICVIEWPKQAKEILPNEYLWIDIFRVDEVTRKLTFKAQGKHYEEIVEALKK